MQRGCGPPPWEGPAQRTLAPGALSSWDHTHVESTDLSRRGGAQEQGWFPSRRLGESGPASKWPVLGGGRDRCRPGPAALGLGAKREEKASQAERTGQSSAGSQIPCRLCLEPSFE